MTNPYGWHESYWAVLVETDWTKMPERIKAAESGIRERQRVLALDHGGTPEERYAIANAHRGLKCLRKDVAEWQKRQSCTNDARTQPD